MPHLSWETCTGYHLASANDFPAQGQVIETAAFKAINARLRPISANLGRRPEKDFTETRLDEDGSSK
jgi:hypothetical protein